MEVIICPDSQKASELAGKIFKNQIRAKAKSVLGLATGATPLALYDELVKLYEKKEVSFERCHSFNLDEYVGIPLDHPAAYASYMKKNFFEKVDFHSKNAHVPNGMASDLEKHCEWYEEKIRNHGGIDLQLLGIGEDGHIGFNEPSSALASRTRIKTLTNKTRLANQSAFREGEMPHHVITMGIATILEARHIVLLAFGEKKAEAVANMVEGPMGAYCPATALQWHPKTQVILDEQAASKLERIDYYKNTFALKPEFQKI